MPKVYPEELHREIIRIYNLVSERDSLKIQGPKLVFKVRKNVFSQSSETFKMALRLAKTMDSIAKKYFPDMSGSKIPVRISHINNDEFIGFEISGVHYVPSASLLRLLNMFLWYEIRLSTGLKPKDSEYGVMKMNQLKQEVERFKSRINISPSKLVHTYNTSYCNFCGDGTKIEIEWILSIRGRKIRCQTPVCDKHRNRKI